jgi:hypothetical protein
MSLVLSVFIFEMFLICLLWVVWVVLNLWIWQKSKASGNAAMMVGAGLLALVSLLNAFAAALGTTSFWLTLIGLIVLTIGFYLSVKPMVAAHLAGLQARMKAVSSPPPSNPPK